MLPVVISVFPSLRKHMYGYLRVKSYLYYDGNLLIHQHSIGEWFNGKTAAFKVADLGSNPCSPAKWYRWNLCKAKYRQSR